MMETRPATFYAADGAVYAYEVNVFGGRTPTQVILNGEGGWRRESEEPLVYREDPEYDRALRKLVAGAEMSDLERALLDALPRKKVLVPVR